MEALQPMAEPAGFTLSPDICARRMAGGDATADALPDRGHDAPVGHGVADDACVWATPVRRQAHSRRAAAADGQGEGYRHLFRRTPEELIIRMVIRLVGRGVQGIATPRMPIRATRRSSWMAAATSGSGSQARPTRRCGAWLT